MKKVDGRTQQGKALKVCAGVVRLFCEGMQCSPCPAALLQKQDTSAWLLVWPLVVKCDAVGLTLRGIRAGQDTDNFAPKRR